MSAARFTLPFPYAHHTVRPEQPALDRDARISSVMPRVVKQLNLFRKSLKPRELAMFDMDDLLQEIWITLIEKDHYYNDTWKYITFANMITNQKLADIRNRWHTVSGPRDTAVKLRNEQTENPELIESIRHTIRDTSTLNEEYLLTGEENEAERSDLQQWARQTVILALQRMSSPRLALVLRWCYGLLDQQPRSITEIAERLHVSNARVIQLRKQAQREMATICESLELASYI